MRKKLSLLMAAVLLFTTSVDVVTASDTAESIIIVEDVSLETESVIVGETESEIVEETETESVAIEQTERELIVETESEETEDIFIASIEEVDDPSDEPAVVSAVANGTCGDDLTWVLTDDGILTISGTGEMENYYTIANYFIDRPWESYISAILTVQIENGVTSIGGDAFRACSNLTSVIIPESVTYIGKEAFRGCDSLTTVAIPESGVTIDTDAFIHCAGLKYITIPGNASIGSCAFWDCRNLENVIIQEGVTSIRYRAFYHCTSLTSITIPDSVTNIGEDVFLYCDSLTDVYFTGSESAWNNISINSGNSCLTNATIHYSNTGIDVADTTGTSMDFDVPGDEWSFSNYSDTPISLTNIDYSALTVNLESSEIAYWNSLLKSGGKGGVCYGLSATSVLVARNVLSLSSISSGITQLYDAKKNTTTESIIGYYHLTQCTDAAMDAVDSFMDKSVEEQLGIIAAMTEPFVFSFGSTNSAGASWAHAVVGYGIEYGSYTYYGVTYPARLLTYDPNVPYSETQTKMENSYLYFNQDTGEWIVPNYAGSGAVSTNSYAYLKRACSDTSVLNSFNYETSKDIVYMNLKQEKSYYSHSLLINSLTLITQIIPYYSNPSVRIYAFDGISLDGTVEDNVIQVRMQDTEECTLTSVEGESLDVDVLYDGIFYSAEADSYTSISFVDDGTVSATGVSGDYSIGIPDPVFS
ncbi:MAG: leucine-rich repeat domain-containing protein [Lachnospiraceae bacterium]|nr:leucine-rich repeat domain-containing protein [Lachnospiraceae bacterium]